MNTLRLVLGLCIAVLFGCGDTTNNTQPDSSGILWLGEFGSAPQADTLGSKNWLYLNTTDKNIYIWNGTSWSVFSSSASNGVNGSNGKDASSCTVTKNEDGTYTLACPDGTSATIQNGSDGKDGSDGGSVATLSLQTSEITGTTSLQEIRLVDSDLIGKTDSVLIKVKSTTDPVGISIKAKLIGYSFVANVGFSKTATSTGIIKVKDGDEVFVEYSDPNPATTISTSFKWNDFVLQSAGNLIVSKTQLFGDNAKLTVTLTDADLSGTTATIYLSGSVYSNTPVSLNGSSGVYSAELTLSESQNQIATGIVKVADGNVITIKYNDLSPVATKTQSVSWNKAVQGSVQFDNDIYATTLSMVRVFVQDADELDSTVNIHLTSSVDADGMDLKLTRSGEYFWADVYLKLEDNSNSKLFIEDGGWIKVDYFDSSKSSTVSDYAYIDLVVYKPILAFGDTAYHGLIDKAVIKLNDYYASGSENVWVWTKSNPTRKEIELHSTYPYVDYLQYIQVGFLGFSTTDSFGDKIQVIANDSIYVEYTDRLGTTVKDTCVWRSN